MLALKFKNNKIEFLVWGFYSASEWMRVKMLISHFLKKCLNLCKSRNDLLELRDRVNSMLVKTYPLAFYNSNEKRKIFLQNLKTLRKNKFKKLHFRRKKVFLKNISSFNYTFKFIKNGKEKNLPKFLFEYYSSKFKLEIKYIFSELNYKETFFLNEYDSALGISKKKLIFISKKELNYHLEDDVYIILNKISKKRFYFLADELNRLIAKVKLTTKSLKKRNLSLKKNKIYRNYVNAKFINKMRKKFWTQRKDIVQVIENVPALKKKFSIFAHNLDLIEYNDELDWNGIFYYNLPIKLLSRILSFFTSRGNYNRGYNIIKYVIYQVKKKFKGSISFLNIIFDIFLKFAPMLIKGKVRVGRKKGKNIFEDKPTRPKERLQIQYLLNWVFLSKDKKKISLEFLKKYCTFKILSGFFSKGPIEISKFNFYEKVLENSYKYRWRKFRKKNFFPYAIWNKKWVWFGRRAIRQRFISRSSSLSLNFLVFALRIDFRKKQNFVRNHKGNIMYTRGGYPKLESRYGKNMPYQKRMKLRAKLDFSVSNPSSWGWTLMYKYPKRKFLNFYRVSLAYMFLRKGKLVRGLKWKKNYFGYKLKYNFDHLNLVLNILLSKLLKRRVKRIVVINNKVFNFSNYFFCKLFPRFIKYCYKKFRFSYNFCLHYYKFCLLLKKSIYNIIKLKFYNKLWLQIVQNTKPMYRLKLLKKSNKI